MSHVTKNVLLSLPALMLLAAAALVFWEPVSSQARAERYLAAARSAVKEQDYTWALLCFRQSHRFQPDLQVKYEQALCLQAMQRPQEAVAAMDALASGPSPFPLARQWLAQYALRNPSADEKLIKKVEQDMESLLKEHPEEIRPRQILAELLSRRGRLAEAVPHG
ncbi:MAG: hypothetical protein N2C14_14635 [Planctomycetales bacterium]